MTMGEITTGADETRELRIAKLTTADIGAALSAGWSDFTRKPAQGLFFGGIYALGGILIAISLAGLHLPWLIIPLAIGFPLLGPFAAVGLYEVSRRLEAGERVTWRGVLAQVFRQRERQMSWMAFAVLFIFWVWVYQVRLLMALILGFRIPATLDAFATLVMTTPQGLAFLTIGTLVGAAIAALLFSVTVISMPLLLDHDLDFVTAMLTSLRAVLANKGPMALFGVIVALATFASMLPAFLGLMVSLPVLGHATWHLYRRTIVGP